MIRRDPAAKFRFARIQSPFGQRLAARFGVDPNDPQTNIVIVQGCAYFKMEAALAVLAELPGWRWTVIARGLPRDARNWLYDRIARNRYSLFGRYDTCMVPSPDVRRRFVPDDLLDSPLSDSAEAALLR